MVLVYVPQAIRDRCNTVTTAKYTNDLMHGLYTTEYMAAHSVTGLGSSSKGETRPLLSSEDVRKIVSISSPVAVGYVQSVKGDTCWLHSVVLHFITVANTEWAKQT